MPVDVRFHTKALQYERGQVVHGLTRGSILDGLIRRGLVEVLHETPDRSVTEAAPERVELPEAEQSEQSETDTAPRRGRKRADDADQ